LWWKDRKERYKSQNTINARVVRTFQDTVDNIPPENSTGHNDDCFSSVALNDSATTLQLQYHSFYSLVFTFWVQPLLQQGQQGQQGRFRFKHPANGGVFSFSKTQASAFLFK
jgi:hypothetical protein